MNQKVILRAQIGWQVGILIGMLGACAVVWIAELALWIKIISTIGLLSASAGTFYGIWQTYVQYKVYMNLLKEDGNEIQKET